MAPRAGASKEVTILTHAFFSLAEYVEIRAIWGIVLLGT
jgi:hypothetical protein